MDIQQIKELIEILEASKLNKLTLKEKDGSEIHLEKAPVVTSYPQMHAAPPMPAPHHHEAPRHHETHGTPPRLGHAQEAPGTFITSPMVGTFYTSAAPGDPAFIKVGDTVQENTIVCIIEAMKVMNEVKAGKKGRVVEICIENSHPVEFGTKLFRIE